MEQTLHIMVDVYFLRFEWIYFVALLFLYLNNKHVYAKWEQLNNALLFLFTKQNTIDLAATVTVYGYYCDLIRVQTGPVSK